MADPSRPLRVDLHTHILPDETHWPAALAKLMHDQAVSLRPPDAAMLARGETRHAMFKGAAGSERFFRAVDSACYSCAAREAACDETGVDVQVLSTVPIMFSYWAAAADGLAIARQVNDDLARQCSERPDRFLGLGELQDGCERGREAMGVAGEGKRRSVQYKDRVKGGNGRWQEREEGSLEHRSV